MPPAAIAEAARHPRLRRSSAISRFAVVAGLGALRDAALELDEASAARTALIFAISNGGVIYTKRFFHEIVKSGAAAASPLLFPETVLTRRPAISRRFSASPARVTPWSAMARSGFSL